MVNYGLPEYTATMTVEITKADATTVTPKKITKLLRFSGEALESLGARVSSSFIR